MCSVSSFVPQAWKIVRTGNTKRFPRGYMS
ncbi:hypothetical protein LJR098_002174 [Rhizobium sp. LjRoot98]